MATNASPFIVNIVDLQNIALNITGTSQASQLAKAQADISDIQEMVDYTTKTISADYIQSFTEGNTIQVLSGLNISTPTSGSSGTNTIGGSNTYINVNDTTSTISFINAGNQSLQFTSTGMLNYISTSTYFSTGINVAGFLYVSETVYAKNVIQTSDKQLKTNIKPFTTCLDDVLQLKPCTFNWRNDSNSDLGFIAQEVKATWPELVTENPDGIMGISYSRFIPLLVESIRELKNRLEIVESKLI